MEYSRRKESASDQISPIYFSHFIEAQQLEKELV